jgi:hypothetical protein
LNTTRNKRWNGEINSLKGDYLNEVLEKMATYGDRVQFALNGKGSSPHYQVINSADKKMAFDSNHHLLQPADDEFAGPNATREFSLDQIKAAMAGGGTAKGAATRAGRASSGRTTTATLKAKDLLDIEKYEYFKNHRQMLPPSIGEHSEEITELMIKGMSAQDAFADVVKRHF